MITFQVTTPTEVANNVLEFRHISDFALGTGSTQLAKGDHTHSPASLGAIPVSSVGVANGLATLDSSGKIPLGQIPTSIVNGSGGTSTTPTVVSVNNKTGIINLTNTDVGAAPTVHTHTVAQVTGLQAILDSKAGAASTLAGYNITDAYTKAEVETRIAAIPPSGGGTGGGTPTPTDTFYVNLSQYNYPYNVSTGTLNNTLATLTGKVIIVDKLYECTDTIVTPADSWLLGASAGCGFKQIGSHKTLVTVNNGVTLENLTFDGNKANTTGTPGFGEGLVRKTGLTKRATVTRCVFKNYRANAIYMGANFGAGTTFTHNYIENTHGGWFSQRSDNLDISNNTIVNVTNDGIKVHGKDGSDANYRAKNVRVENNLVDFKTIASGQITGNILAIEVWGSVDNFVVTGNTVIAPDINPGQVMWGISIDASKYGVVSNNYVDGGPQFLFAFGLEAAGVEDCVYQGNTTNRVGFGLSISQPNTRNLKVVHNTFQNTKAASSSTIQFLGGVFDCLVDGNTFRDFGTRGIHLNGVGSGVAIINNFFYIKTQTGSAATCIQNQGGKNVKITGNTCGPELQTGVTPGTATMRFLDTDSMVNSNVSGNFLDCKSPSGTSSTSSAITVYGSTSGGNLIENNVGYNCSWVVANSGQGAGSYLGRNRGVNVSSGNQTGTTKDKLVNFLD